MGNPFAKLFGKDKGKSKTDPAPVIGGGPGVADLIPAAPAGPAPAPAFLPAAPRAAERAGSDTGTPVRGTLQIGRDRSRITDNRLITVEKVMERPAFKAAKSDDLDVYEILASIAAYQEIISSNRIPAADSPDFVGSIGRINAAVLSSHEALESKLADGHELFEKKTERAKKKDKAAFSLLWADCGKLATLAHSQKNLLNKVYDDIMTAVSSNPEALSNFVGKNYQELLNTSSLYKLSDNAEVLGGGAINTVYRAGTPEAPKVFKEGTTHQRSKIEKIGRMNKEKNIGLAVMTERMGYEPGRIDDYGKDFEYKPEHEGVAFANTAQRDVAVSRIDKLFELDIAVNTQLASSQRGNTSSIMDLAQGIIAGSLSAYYYSKEENREVAKYYKHKKLKNNLAFDISQIEINEKVISEQKAALQEAKSQQEREKINDKIEDSKKNIRNLNSEIIEINKVLTNANEEVYVNIQSPEVVGQLFRMTLLDLIVGHVDRHAGNYMISNGEAGVKIKAIDNDTSFGLNTDIMDGNPVDGVYPKLKAAFPFVPPEIRDKVQAVSEENIRNALTGLLGQPEINAACERFRIVKSFIEQMEIDKKVEDYDQNNESHINVLYKRILPGSYHSNLYYRVAETIEEKLKPEEISELKREERAEKEASAQPTVADETQSTDPNPLPKPDTEAIKPPEQASGAVPNFQNVRPSGSPQRPSVQPFLQRRNKPMPASPGN